VDAVGADRYHDPDWWVVSARCGVAFGARRNDPDGSVRRRARRAGWPGDGEALLGMKLAETPAPLRHYVLAVVLGGPLLVVAVAAMHGLHGLNAGDWLRAGLLTVLVAASFGRPLRVGHRHTYDASELGHVAMILLFPVWLPGMLVAVAGGANLVRRRRPGIDELFNVAQVMLYVTVGAVALDLLRDEPGLGPAPGGLAPLGSVGLAAALMLVVNVALVAGAVALQSGRRFWRQFRAHLSSLVAVHAALVALGVVAALLFRDYPLALLPLVLPAALAQYAARREVQLLADTRAALAALVDVVELRDPYTAGHSERVAATAREMALRLGLTGEEADLVETAGRVHDLGKVAMDLDLFHKPGSLSDDEWRHVRDHPVQGADIVARFAGYSGCAPLVRHHHERWDGGGYPDGLAAEAIPLGARILAVADSWDAMTTARAYRPALCPHKVLAILEDGAGTQWDPRVVAAFVAWRREAATPAADPALAPRPAPA
jgi:HD-GYP domain-containing protein (c-di-GMP phosphodiesterase class II)